MRVSLLRTWHKFSNFTHLMITFVAYVLELLIFQIDLSSFLILFFKLLILYCSVFLIHGKHVCFIMLLISFSIRLGFSLPLEQVLSL